MVDHPNNHPIAAYYRNGAIHHFVDRAIIELGLLAADDGMFDLERDAFLTAGQAEALRIRDLLKFGVLLPAQG